MAAGDLVTLAEVQVAYPHLDPDQLADMPGLISAVSAEVAGRYPRAAASGVYDETHEMEYDRVLRLKRRPVTRVNRLRADMASVLLVRYTGPARRATVEVASTGEADLETAASVNLVTETGGVAAASVVVDFATYPTLQAVADRVNTVSGWTATASPTQGTMAAADLEPGQGPLNALARDAGLYAYTKDVDDFALDRTRGTVLLYEWRLPGYRFPDRTWGVDPRTTQCRVSYTAGLVTVPPDVKRAAIVIVGDLLEATDKTGPVNSARSDDYAYTLASPTYRFPATAERALSRYKDRGVN